MRGFPVLLMLGVALAACGSRSKHETTATVSDDGKTVSGLSIDTDGFKAKFDVAGMSFGGDHMDLDGIKLYPGSTVNGVRVDATDRKTGANDTSKNAVTIDFVSPAAPALVAAHLADEARKGGFAVIGVSSSGLSGSKTERDGKANRFAFVLAPSGAATKGQLTISDSGHKVD